LNPAEYDVTVELSGFAKETRQSVTVDVGQAVAVNLAMDVDRLDVVMMVAPPPAIDALTPEVSTTIDTRRVNELPLNGRDFTRLALFAPGVVQTVGLIVSIAVNPTDVSQNSFLLDGVDATRIDDARPSNGFERGSRLQTASVESIDEFRVLTRNYSAEYGRAAGAVISAVTKSGANVFHGSRYGFVQPRVLFELRLSSLDTAMPHAAVRAAHSASGHGQGADTFESHAPNIAPPSMLAIDARCLVQSGSWPGKSHEVPAMRVTADVSTFGAKPGTASSSTVAF
jgi:hypothetical protein